MNIDIVATPPGFVSNRTGKPVPATVFRQDVEIHPAHYLLLSSRYCVSKGTGRPVAPLFFPDVQAVPAISRCAQWNFSVKRDRKQAAVMVPASLPPMLAMSANGLDNCLLYSSQS